MDLNMEMVTASKHDGPVRKKVNSRTGNYPIVSVFSVIAAETFT